MGVLKKHKTIYGGFANKVEYYRFVYDVADGDPATAAAHDIATFGEDLIIVHAHIKILDAVTSTGNATVSFGYTSNATRFVNATQGAKANLTTGTVVLPLAVEGTPNVIATPALAAKGNKLLMTIGTEALNGGKIEFVIGVLKP